MHQINIINDYSFSKRLHVTYCKTDLIFLIDIGSDLSIVSEHSQNKCILSNYVIYAANNSRINTFGRIELSLDLSLCRNFHWNFCIASVPYPIIGPDFLTHFWLSVSLRNYRLIDSVSDHEIKCHLKIAAITDISSIGKTISFYLILSKVSEVINPVQKKVPDTHGVYA